jgi:hypothetical protein
MLRLVGTYTSDWEGSPPSPVGEYLEQTFNLSDRNLQAPVLSGTPASPLELTMGNSEVVNLVLVVYSQVL